VPVAELLSVLASSILFGSDDNLKIKATIKKAPPNTKYGTCTALISSNFKSLPIEPKMA
jgi:hypothetical protein